MKDRVTWLVFMFPFCLCYLIVWKVHFLQFFADLSKNLSLLKKLTWMHVKGLVMLFKKMVFFIMLWLTVSDFLLRSRQNSKKVKKETLKPCKLHHFFMYLFSCNCLHHSSDMKSLEVENQELQTYFIESSVYSKVTFLK